MGHPLFINQRNDPLIQAIIDAQQNPECVGRLFELLQPVLERIARRIASQVVEDAVQAALIRVWRKIGNVDVTRPETAKAYLIRAGVSAMRDEVRKYLRLHKLPTCVIESEELLPAAALELETEHFDGILQLYVAYVEQTGDFHGAHKHVGDLMGVTTARASTLFHQASKDYIDRFKRET